MLSNRETFESKHEITFPLSPLIRVTLLLLYLAVVLPLPFMAPNSLRNAVLSLLLLGMVLIWSLVSEKVIISRFRITRSYPDWCLWFASYKWEICWNNIKRLIPVTSSQGGKVYYIISKNNQSYLLPQRVTRFDKFVEYLQDMSGLNLALVNRLTPPWTYQLLATLSILTIAGEILCFLFIRSIYI